MRYPGSKRRIAHDIEQLVLTHKGDRDVYIEPFVGGANSFTPIQRHFTVALGADTNADLIALYQAVQGGWEPPTLDLTREEYALLRSNSMAMCKGPDPWRGLVGVGGSYSGKWFGGHAHGGYGADGSPRNHLAESWRALQKQAGHWGSGVRFQACDYTVLDNLRNPDECVIYCDPPYKGVTGFGSEAFDSEAYYEFITQFAMTTDAVVVCSEYTMPEPTWKPVWSREQLQSLSLAGDRGQAIESLWMIV